MIITKIYNLKVTDEMIENIINEFKNECDSWAEHELQDLDLDWDEYKEYREKFAKEIFQEVATKLMYDYKKVVTKLMYDYKEAE